MEKVRVMPMGYILTETMKKEENGWYSVEMSASSVSTPIYFKPAKENEQSEIFYGKLQKMFQNFSLAQRYSVDQVVNKFFYKCLN